MKYSFVENLEPLLIILSFMLILTIINICLLYLINVNLVKFLKLDDKEYIIIRKPVKK